MYIKDKEKRKKYRKEETDLLMPQAVTVTLYTQISLEMSPSCYIIKVTTIIIPST
jgi:hypothetical protein